jgi:hypothetical protein
MPHGLGLGPAVAAHEVTGPGDLPEDHEGLLAEVDAGLPNVDGFHDFPPQNTPDLLGQDGGAGILR